MPFRTKGLQIPTFHTSAKLFPVKSIWPREEQFQKSTSVMAACRVLAEFLGALTATNSHCKGIIKAGKWFRDISSQNLSQSKGSTRRKSAPCLCTRFSLHFCFTSRVLKSWHRYNTCPRKFSYCKWR